jgi:hypothetical protein
LKAILLGLIFIIVMVVLFFGGSMPNSFRDIQRGSFRLEFKPLIDFGGMFERKSESIQRSMQR